MKKLVSLLLALVLCSAPVFTACQPKDNEGGGPGGDPTRTEIVMQGFGNDQQKAEYTAMVKAFNQSEYARQNNLTLRMTQFLADTVYVQGIESGNTLSSDNKVDIIFVDDRHFKKWANYGFVVDVKAKTSSAAYQEKLNNMWSSIYPRFRYNRNGNTSYADDPLWGVPVDTSPTAIYYNRQAMENVGIIVISVDDEVVTDANFDQYAKEYAGLTAEMKGKNLMDLWNENKIADKFGQYHNTCGNRDNEEQKYPLSGNTTGAGYAADILAQPDEYAGTETIVVPKKGFFRQDSFNNFIGTSEANSDSSTWDNPNADGVNEIVKVFNASIAMNWDETEDLARLLSIAQNKNNLNRKAGERSVATTYGYYTEWWFNYGWSVGGDCLQDLTGEGTWTYGLADWSANYKVTENALDQVDENGNKYYLGANTGTHYKAGDTLEYLDKLNVKAYGPKVDEEGRYEKDEDGNIVFNKGDLLIPAQNGGLRTYNTETGKESDVIGGSPKEYTSDASIRSEIKNNATTDITVNPDAKFIQLPSTKAAVNRYLNCVGKSLGIMPTTKGTQSGFDTVAQFGDGRIAMIVERGYEIGRLREFTKANSIEWGVAPLPQYKEYKNPTSNDTTVKAQGVKGGHSEATALCITKTSKNADNAWKVIDWLTSDTMTVKGTTENAGQYYKALAGYIPNQPTLANSSTFIKDDEKNLNLDIFFDMLEYEKAGDWWYLSDNAWIDIWANPLNSQVRNDEMSAETWFNNYTIASCNKLIEYSYYFGSDAYKSIYTQGLQRA